jgi:hypothetical protein
VTKFERLYQPIRIFNVLIQSIDVVINVMGYSGHVVGDDLKIVYIFGVNSSDVNC